MKTQYSLSRTIAIAAAIALTLGLLNSNLALALGRAPSTTYTAVRAGQDPSPVTQIQGTEEYQNFRTALGTRAAETALTHDHLLYFGPFDNGGSRMQETKGYSNLIWLAAWDPNIVGYLATAATLNLKVLLATGKIFFNSNQTLRRNYQTRWQAVLAQIAPYRSSIVAIYHVDEPLLHTAAYSSNSAVSGATMGANLKKVNNYIHATFPGVATAVTYSQNEVAAPDFYVNRTFDWVGFDCYEGWANCDGKGHSAPWFKNRLAKKIFPHQRMFLVPQAFVWTKKKYGSAEQQMPSILSRLEQFYQMALADSRVIAILPFSYTDYSGLLGYRHYRAIESKVSQIGTRIINLPRP